MAVPRLRHLLAVLCSLLLPAAAATGQITFPGAEWTSIAGDADSLEAAGYDADRLRTAARFVRDSTAATGLVVVDGGRVVLEFGDVVELSYVASVRKSVLAMLYGRYVADGTIDLDRTLADLGFDDEGGLSDRERSARVWDLITARSGVYHPASNAGDNSADAPPRDSVAPGTYFLYNNWDFNAAGAAFEASTGRDIYDALASDLAGPIAMQDFDRAAQRKSGDLERSRYPAYHMWLSTRDMARLGLLMLAGGTWNGTQVVPGAWAGQIVSLVTPLAETHPAYIRDGELGYGVMWWVWDGPTATGAFQGAFTASGAYGQYITVLPALNLVVALKTKSDYGRRTSLAAYRRLLDRIVVSKTRP